MGMESTAADIFSSLLNPGGKPERKKEAPRRATTVTPNTIARVRQEQAEEAHAAQIAAVEAEKNALLEEIETQKAVVESLAEDLAAARAEAEESRAAADAHIAQLEADCARLAAEGEAARHEHEAECDAIRKELAAEKAAPKVDPKILEECAAKDREIERLQALLIEAQRTSLSSSVLLEKPEGFVEKFPGEVREHVMEALADAAEAAEAGGRDRRSRILESVQCANPSSGELAERRAQVKQILKDAGSFIDDTTIAALEKLGFRYISGSNHHKLEFAGIRFPVAKTPSDHRSCLNSAAEICNRIF